MSTNTQFHLDHGTPTKCAHCSQPLRIVDTHIECWRSSNGKFFCSEFCAKMRRNWHFKPSERCIHQCDNALCPRVRSHSSIFDGTSKNTVRSGLPHGKLLPRYAQILS